MKHASAERVTVELVETADRVRLSVADDGRASISPRSARASGSSAWTSGLPWWAARCRSTRRRAQGTTVRAEVPARRGDGEDRRGGHLLRGQGHLGRLVRRRPSTPCGSRPSIAGGQRGFCLHSQAGGLALELLVAPRQVGREPAAGDLARRPPERVRGRRRRVVGAAAHLGPHELRPSSGEEQPSHHRAERDAARRARPRAPRSPRRPRPPAGSATPPCFIGLVVASPAAYTSTSPVHEPVQVGVYEALRDRAAGRRGRARASAAGSPRGRRDVRARHEPSSPSRASDGYWPPWNAMPLRVEQSAHRCRGRPDRRAAAAPARE